MAYITFSNGDTMPVKDMKEAAELSRDLALKIVKVERL